jgi:hypothetical protein
MKHKIGTYLRNGLFFFLAFFLSIMAAEGAIRVLFPKYSPSDHLRFPSPADGDPVQATMGSRKRQIKNTGDYDVEVRFDKLGFRDSKELSSSDSNSIFAVGGSFTFGWGVEEKDRFSNVVEPLLGRRVFNVAVPTSVRFFGRQMGYAEKNGAKITTMIVEFFMESDLYDYELELNAHEGFLRGTRGQRLLKRVKTFLRDNSALYFLVTVRIHASPALVEHAVATGLMIPDDAKFNSTPVVHNNTIETATNELARVVQDRKCVILIVPSRALWLGNDANRKRALSIHNAFLENLSQRHLNYVDMRPYFEELGDPLKYNFRYDVHWNAAGHLLAGKKLAEYIKQHGL